MVLSAEALALIASRFEVLAESMRVCVPNTIGSREMAVTGHVEVTGAGQAIVAKHRGLLRGAGTVRRRGEGLNAFYSVADESIFVVCEVVFSSLSERQSAQQRPLGGPLR